jgi:hypothetical protein
LGDAQSEAEWQACLPYEGSLQAASVTDIVNYEKASAIQHSIVSKAVQLGRGIMIQVVPTASNGRCFTFAFHAVGLAFM